MSKITVGGQAIIEGVMMRAGKSLAMAARRPDGTVVLEQLEIQSWSDRLKFLKWPIVRGGVVFIESLYWGIKALDWSGQQALAAEAKAEGKPAESSRGDRWMLVVTLLIGVVLGVLLFVVIPFYAAHATSRLVPVGSGNLAFNLINGVYKAAIFLFYLWFMSWIPDLRRVFQYHGAEHKSIFTWEANSPLLPSEAEKQSRFHPRCSTAFLLMVMVVAILTFALFLPRQLSLFTRLGGELLLLLPIAGVTYELQRFSARYQKWAWVRWLTKPGLWLQAMTTREPEIPQLEVALAALQAVLAMEEKRLGKIEPEEIPCGIS